MSKNFASFAAPALSLALVAGCASPKLGRSPAPVVETSHATSPHSTPAETPRALEYPQARPLDEKRPVKIKSDRLRYNDALKETEFIGHVVATQDTATLYADRMRSKNQGEAASASGNLRLIDTGRKVEILASEGDYEGALSEANLRGGVRLHSVDPYAVPVTVTGQSAWYHSVSRKARLEGGVFVERGTLTATAERALVDGAGERLELLGGVSARLGANSVASQSAVMDGAKRSVAFEGKVEASLIPAQIRERASHPERP